MRGFLYIDIITRYGGKTMDWYVYVILAVIVAVSWVVVVDVRTKRALKEKKAAEKAARKKSGAKKKKKK